MMVGVKVRFAVAPGTEVFDPGSLTGLVDALEALGFDTLWLSDLPMGDVVDPIVGLSYAASRTRRLKLGANLVPLGRNPMLLAKELAQLDRLSDGRLLLSIVPGVDQPGERAALGVGRDRYALIEETMPLLRRWWAGEAVTHHGERWSFDEVRVRPTPVQQPLELWLGGQGPKALDRVGRLADGWLGAAMTPAECTGALARIQAAAATAGRTIDPEHFGLSVPYAHDTPPASTLAGLAARRPGVAVEDLLPVGVDGLRRLVDAYVAAGVTKFVLRPVDRTAPWPDELGWLADAVLDRQR